jgi:hypothetical protein
MGWVSEMVDCKRPYKGSYTTAEGRELATGLWQIEIGGACEALQEAMLQG